MRSFGFKPKYDIDTGKIIAYEKTVKEKEYIGLRVTFKYLANNFIPVQKVKDKIEQLKSKLEFETIEREAKLQIELLKSLLEED